MSLDIEPTRVVTGKSTIPAGVAASGTATTSGTLNTILEVTGGTIADMAKYLNTGYRNIWIYLVTGHKVAKVTSVLRVSNTVYRISCDRAVSGVVADTFTVVIGDLMEWGAQNVGASAGEVAGAPLPAGSADNRTVIHLPGNGYPIERDVVTVDGTGTTIKIYEVKHAQG